MANHKILTDVSITGDVSASNLSGTNTGDNAVNSNYSGLVSDTGVPALLSNGSTPSLNSGITAQEVTDVIGALRNSYTDVDMDTYDDDRSLLLGRDQGGWQSGTKPAGSHNGFGILHVTTHSGGYATQFGFDTNQNKMWVRSKNPTSWGAWKYMYTTQDFSAAQIAEWITAYDHSQETHAPSNAEANVQSDWNAGSGDAHILNKPTIPSGNSVIDWTTDQGSTNIHANNYTDTNTFRAISSTPTNGATTTSISSDWAFDNVKTAVPANAVFTDNDTTYVSSDFTHDDLTGFVANEHLDWTTDQGSTNIHANNYTNTNTWRPIDDTPVNGVTDQSISSNWAFDNVKTPVPAGAVFTDTDTNTTYTAGSGLELSGTTFKINGGVIGGGQNLNNYDESGYYTQNSNSDANSGTNYPTNYAGVLTVVRSNDNNVHVTQTYDQYNSSAFYNRSFYNGTWSSWRNLAQDSDTWRPIDDTPVNGATTESISSNWAFDNVKTAVPAGAVFTDNNTTYVSSDFNHDDLTGFVTKEHLDWTADQGSNNIHANNYTNTNTWRGIDDTPVNGATSESISSNWAFDNVKTAVPSGALFTDTNTTYVSSDFTHDDLTGFVAKEHLDWTADQGANNIHANNYTNTNTWRGIDDTPVNGATTESISSNWAFDNVKTAVPAGALFTDTIPAITSDGSTPSLNSGISAAEVRSLIGAGTGDGTSTYVHTDHGAKAVSTSDAWIMHAMTTDIYGHVKTVGIRNLTLAHLGYTGATNANYSTNNVTTNITTTHNSTNVVVNSSDGTNGTINAATATLSGVMTAGSQTLGGLKSFSGGVSLIANTGDLDLNNNDILGANSIFHEGDTNTYMQFHSNDQWRVVTGGAERLEVNNSQVLASHSMRAPVFYDSNNTSYYGNFASTSHFNSMIYKNNSTPIKIKVNSGYKSWVHHIGSNDSYVIAPSTTDGGETWDWSNQFAFATNGAITANNFILASDRRLKDNIEDLKVESLDVKWKSFEMKSDENSEKRVGVIAQELEETNPEFVNTDEKGFKSVKYIDLLITKVAELEERIKQLEK